MSLPSVTVLGTGYVGLTTAAMLAASGVTTYVVDPDQRRLDSVRAGRSFFYEQGLDNLIGRAVATNKLRPTSDYGAAVPYSQVVISAVGTPDNPDGSSNLEYVYAAAREAARHAKAGTVYVQKSTVPVGTGQALYQLLNELGSGLSYVANPEFLRESTALIDSLWFDRVVVGSQDTAAAARVIDIYKHVEANRSQLAALAGVEAPAGYSGGRYITASLPSAELIKVTANAFLALKISFANSIARLADRAGADICEVMDAVGADQRIGRAFLQAGRGYGGGCFPKDVSGLLATSLEYGVDLEIMQAAQAVNEAMPPYVLNRLQTALDSPLHGRTIAVLGLAFKAGTSDARRSPGVQLCNLLVRAGAFVQTYDPRAMAEAAASLSAEVQAKPDCAAALAGAEAALIATEWPEFIDQPPAYYATHLSGNILVDAVNRLDPTAVQAAGLRYIGIGRRAPDQPPTAQNY